MPTVYPGLQDEEPTTLEGLLALYEEERASFETRNSQDAPQPRIGKPTGGYYYAWLLGKPFDPSTEKIPSYKKISELDLPKEFLLQMNNKNNGGVANTIRRARDIDDGKREKDPENRITFLFGLEVALSGLGLAESKLKEILQRAYTLYFSKEAYRNPNFDVLLKSKVYESLSRIERLSKTDYKSLACPD